MKINSINPSMYTRTAQATTERTASFKAELAKNEGVNNDYLALEGNASKYFSIEKNISNEKVGSKFIIKSNDFRFDDINLLITPDSEIKGKDFSVSIKKKDDADVSFKGTVYGSIRKDDTGEDKTMMNAYSKFWTSGMYDTVSEKYVSPKANQLKDDYNFFTPTDGDGTRYKDITAIQGGMTKPASYIPATLNGKNMSLIQATLTNFARTSKLDNGCEFIKVKPAEGSAYALLEGLKNGQIGTDKPIVFCWGDNFSDIDVTNLMLDHEAKNSGFTITTIKTDTENVKRLSVIKRNEENPEAIDVFEEKPQDEDFIKSCVIPELGDDTVLSSVGPFVLSPEALEWIKDGYTADPDSFYIPGKKFDFSQGIIKPMLDAFNNGEILDKETGEPLKMTYRVKEDSETWSDLGAQKDLSQAMKNIKKGNAYVGLPAEIISSMAKNIDDNGNITMNRYSKELFNALQEEVGFEAKNVIVSDFGQRSLYGHA